jgi:class 3 adenylate cyclase/tetratricopeptide (TPR) repeat protein
MRVQLLGRFALSTGGVAFGDAALGDAALGDMALRDAAFGDAASDGRVAGPWPRPSARRLVELLLVSPDRRIRRDLACEALFGGREQRAAARALSKALSMARTALGGLGEPGGSRLAADLTHIWIAGQVEVDAHIHEAALRAALGRPAGDGRARELRAVLASASAGDELLADEPDEEWARAPRERLAALRQEARLALARDLASGREPGNPDEVTAAWRACLESDPACEEAAGALARAHLAGHRPEQAVRVLQRCRAALEELGLRLSPSLESAYTAATAPAAPPSAPSARATSAEAPVAGVPAAAASSAAVPAPAPREERRPVSVLFAEVAVSPAAGGTGDLEALRESVAGALAAVMTEAEALGGTVTSVSGRGIQVLFGVPVVHEDDPERAVRAAYRAAARTSDPHVVGTAPGTVLRIGVESGPAVVGPVAGAGRAEYAAFGDVVSVAAALQSAARPGSVLVGPATRTATDQLFTWGDAQRVALDPGAEPVTASCVQAPLAHSGGRRPALGGTAPLTGRDAEIRELATALRDLAAARGSAVALTGEPGIGKTRLAREARTRFLTRAGARTGRLPLWLEGRCSSYTSGTPYGLYRDLLAGWTGVSPDQPADQRLTALERALLQAMGNANLLPPLARMTGLPWTEPGRPAGPAETQRMIIGAMRALITRLTAMTPTVLVLEDLHWADPTSLHLTRHLAGLTRDRPLLMLVTARPEAVPDIETLTPGARRIPLHPLPGGQARALTRSLIGEAAEDVLDAVVSPAGGNPLFLEEQLAALLETRALVRDQGEWGLRETADPRLSQVLERLVRSRIDRLGPVAQRAVRAASVLGPEFGTAQLSAMLGQEPSGELERALEELRSSGLVQRRHPHGPGPSFAFRHALIQEAAYLGLLRAERRDLHARAAAAIEAAGAGPETAAVLGRHYASAGRAQEAVRFLEIAGDHATGEFANDEAITSLRTAIGLTAGHDSMAATAVRLHDKLANVLWRTDQRAAARQAFGAALRTAEIAGTVSALDRAHLHIRLGRVSLPDALFAEAAAAFDAAEELLGDDPGGQDDEAVDQWLELMIEGRSALYGRLGESGRGDAVLDQVRPLVEARGTPARKTAFYRYVAANRIARNGMLPAGGDIELLRRSLEFGRQTGEAKDAAYAAHFLGWALGLRGDLTAARPCQEEAVDLAERIGESNLLPAALTGLALTALRQDNRETARSALARVTAVARENKGDEEAGDVDWGPVARLMLAWLDQPRESRPEDLASELTSHFTEKWSGQLLHLAWGVK